MEISTLSLFPDGDTHRPCVCRLVSLKQACSLRCSSLHGSSRLSIAIPSRWPGATLIVGATKSPGFAPEPTNDRSSTLSSLSVHGL